MIVFDAEIVNCIPGREPNKPEYQYCEGWTDFVGMEISCVCIYDFSDKRPRVFLQDNLPALNELIRKTDCVVGFNNHKFDNNLLRAHGVEIDRRQSYDILEEIWRSAGIGTTFNPKTHGGLSLDAFAAANFGMKKTGSGKFAPELWQDGKYGEVIDYCHADVYLTRLLLEQIINKGWLINPKTNKKIWIRKPSPEVKYG
jgi:hypothetical protein